MCDFVQLKFHMLSLLFWFAGSPESNILREHETLLAQGAIYKTPFSKVNKVSRSYISSHQLRNAVKSHIWTRGD
jgi:hypothetical protein